MSDSSDLIQRAREYATNAHKRIDHRRKYTQQPYSVHLASVAKLVSGVVDDAEIVAAAWLHDVVEDTPATLFDIEKEFGKRIAQLVDELTDISKPSDGNRVVRKTLDRQHLASASADAKTIKLADLTDNCRDICRNDKRFARTYIEEMQLLMDVLTEGDASLYKQAARVLEKCRNELGAPQKSEAPFVPPPTFWQNRLEHQSHLGRLFTESFTAQDIAEPIRSFDLGTASSKVLAVMEEQNVAITCLRENGLITGYVRRSDLSGKRCGTNIRKFRSGQILTSDSSLSDVIHVLTLHEYCFITLLGDVVGYVSRSEINKPVVRMWLFGIITFLEMELVQMINDTFPQGDWTDLVSEGRLRKARELQEERIRRNQHCELIDCLQLSDKGQILLQRPEFLETVVMESKRAGRRIVRELESLRNNLAHAQDIATHDWAPIVRLTYRIEESVSMRRSTADASTDSN